MDAIETMAAGRELDALVAERVMGWVWAQDDPAAYSTMFRPGHRYIVPPDVFEFSRGTLPADTALPLAKEWYGNVPRYSTDLAAAWLVVEHLKRKDRRGHENFWLAWDNYGTEVPQGPAQWVEPQELAWICSFDRNAGQWATADTAPLAICRAALLAVKS